MRIYLIRHGETDWNKQGRFQGREDIALNENGIMQAKRCASALSEERFKAVISSPLIRARRTAEIIAEQLGITQLLIEEGITERDFAKISGMTPGEREAFYASGELDDQEPWEDVCDRMIDSLRKYAEQFHGEDIIMISHGASINSVLSILSGGKTGTGKIILKNTCINIIYFEEDMFRLGEYNLAPEEYRKATQFSRSEPPEYT
jgi:broad specificity phosphatase PhoE